jgi:hypothetical protein
MTGFERTSFDFKLPPPDAELREVAASLHAYDGVVRQPSQSMLQKAQQDLQRYGFPVVSVTNAAEGKNTELTMKNGEHYALDAKGNLLDATYKQVDPSGLLAKTTDSSKQGTANANLETSNNGQPNAHGEGPSGQTGLSPEGLNCSLPPPDGYPGLHYGQFGLNTSRERGVGLGLSYKAYELGINRGYTGKQLSISRRIGEHSEAGFSYSLTTRTAILGFKTELGHD